MQKRINNTFYIYGTKRKQTINVENFHIVLVTVCVVPSRYKKIDGRPNFYLISSIDGKYESHVEQLNSPLLENGYYCTVYGVKKLLV